VSRGAQQNYFPHKTALIAEAVRHLALRQIEELHAHLAAVPRGRARVQAGLDVLFEQYSGRLFAAVVELSLAARAAPELRDVVATEERNISHAMHEAGIAIFGESFPAVAARWPMVISAIRGLAMLHLLGHPRAAVERQWATMRRQLVEQLG
jgi:AcrR family transcriptional regulator